MKKIISLIICVILVFGINFISNAGAVEPKDVELDDLYMLEQLSPYLSIIDKLNKEYKGEFVIPEGGLIEVYNNTLKIPLNEFEDIYRRYYEELKNIPTIINIDVRENQNIKSSNDANSLETIDLPAIEAKAPIESSDAIIKIIQM